MYTTPTTPNQRPLTDEEREARIAQRQREEDEQNKRVRKATALSRWRRCGLMERHAQKIAFPDIRLTEPITHPQWAARWDVVRARLGTGALMILLGRRGTGKSQLAGLACAHVCLTDHPPNISHDDYRPAVYTTAQRFFSAVRGTYRRDTDSTEAQIIREHLWPSLLVIDEIGERGETAWENRLLSAMIDERYGAMRDTIIVANLTPDQLAVSMGESVMDRAREGGGIVLFDWQSFRGAT